MIKLILIRHGECLGQGTYLGRRTDPPLSDSGRLQAERLKTRLLETGVVSAGGCIPVYSSGMRRAVETAEIIFGDCFGGAAERKISDLAEIDFGEWDGMSADEIVTSYGDEYRKWLEDPFFKSPPCGESLNDFNARVADSLNRVLDEAGSLQGDESVTAAVVSHGGVLRSIICSLLGLPGKSHWSFTIDCGSYSIVNIYPDGKSGRTAVLEKLNCS